MINGIINAMNMYLAVVKIYEPRVAFCCFLGFFFSSKKAAGQMYYRCALGACMHHHSCYWLENMSPGNAQQLTVELFLCKTKILGCRPS